MNPRIVPIPSGPEFNRRHPVKKILIVGHPRSGTSLLAGHLASLGLRTVRDARQHADYPSGFMEHLPSLLFAKACERLRGQRDRLTEESLIKPSFLDIPCMRAMFKEAYAVFEDPEVDFLKLPDHALALDFMHQQFPHLRFLAVWRRSRQSIESFYRREFGRQPGMRGLFYAIGTWNMYARRIIDFKTRHPELIDIVGIDEFVSSNRSLADMLVERGYDVPSEHRIREVLDREWRRSTGVIGHSVPLFEKVFRWLRPVEQRVFFESDFYSRRLEALSA
jgi:hypothetical protein